MKFELAREDLLIPLQKVSGVVEKRQTLPILSNALICLEDGRLTFTGTDLEVQLQATMQVDSGTAGQITVPVRKFFDIVRLLPEQSRVSVHLEGDKFRIRSGRSRFVLKTLEAENYPQFDEYLAESEFRIESRVLKKAFEKTVFCMAHQDVRYYLNGAMLEVDNRQLKLVASDGHRLALYEGQLSPIPSAESQQIIIPRKGMLELHRLLDDSDTEVLVQFSKNAIRVAIGNVTFSAKLIDGRYPDFNKVLSRAGSGDIQVDREVLRNALSRVSILSNEKHKGLSVTIEPESMVLRTYNTEHDEAEEEIGIGNDGNVGLSVGFNAQYLLDAVSNVDAEQAHLSFAEGTHSCFIKDPSNPQVTFIVMPMRL